MNSFLPEPQAERVETENRLASDDDRVLSKIVVGDRHAPSVPCAVDLDHEAARPSSVEVPAAVAVLPEFLAHRLGQAVASAHPREVQLAQRMRSTGDVKADRFDEPSSATTADDARRGQQLIGRAQALLHGHRKDEGRLTIRCGPVRGADHRDGRPHPWDSCADDFAHAAPSDLVQPHARDGHGPSGVDHGDMDVVLVIAPEPGSEEGTHTIDGRHGRAALPHGTPEELRLAQLARVDGNGVATVNDPPAAVDLLADVVPLHAHVREARPGGHAAEVCCDPSGLLDQHHLVHALTLHRPSERSPSQRGLGAQRGHPTSRCGQRVDVTSPTTGVPLWHLPRVGV
jgi:hypothetical protein